ncbi:hypothetical protein BV898_15756 [Hypsibius exemplaris]|uniref:Receptor ligand binding region domain-containing protein n=1 Tax=Hypsibius exemplaris TaxID=2072580 RepID=A0A9X6NKR1_HYPEX|nr:hypothetical protein BV898_15756 [Hypsibius exemplaris]
MLARIWSLMILFMFSYSVTANVIQVEIACPGFFSLVNDLSLGYHGAAFDAALTKSNVLYNGVFNFTLTVLLDPVKIRDGLTLDAESVNLIAAWYYRRRDVSDIVRVIITPGSIDSTNVQQLMASWNIFSMITSEGSKSRYNLRAPLLIGLSFTGIEYIAITFVDTLRLFNWTSVFLVADSDSLPMFSYVGSEIIKAVIDVNSETAQTKRITIVERRVASRNAATFKQQLTIVLREFRGSSRVMIFLARGDVVRALMMTAHSTNMTNGDFVHLAFEVTPILNRESNITWQQGAEDDEAARKAFRSLLLIHAREEERQTLNSLVVQKLEKTVRDHSQQLFNVTYSAAQHPLAGMISAYRSIEIFAQVLNDSRSQRGVSSIFDGYNLSRMFLNRSFESDLSDIFIDGTGNRRVELAVTYFAADKGGSRQARNTAFRLFEVHSIFPSWLDGKWPPPNEPRCGYTDLKFDCLQAALNVTSRVSISSSGSVLFATAAEARVH